MGLRLGAGISGAYWPSVGRLLYDSTRCAWRGVARTATQREQAIRFWLESRGYRYALPSAAEVERRFMAELDQD